MATKPTVIRHSELLNSLVIDRTTTDDRGRIELLWMYPQAHRVLGFICKSGLVNAKRLAFTLPQIKAIQDKNLWVEGEPTETETNQVNQLETLLYHEVWSESGAFLGKVKDCLFELKTGKVTQYLVALKGLRSLLNELYSLSPKDVLSFGKKRILVSDRAAEAMKNQRDRLQQALTGLRRDYQSLKEELFTFSQRAQNITQETIQKTVDSLKDLGEQIGEQIGEQFSEVNETIAETDLESQTKAKERSKTRATSPQSDIHTAQENPSASVAAPTWVEQIQAESETWDDLEEESGEADEFDENEFDESEFEDSDEFADPDEFEDLHEFEDSNELENKELEDSLKTEALAKSSPTAEVWDDWNT